MEKYDNTMVDISKNVNIMVLSGIPFKKVILYIKMLSDIAAASLEPKQTLNSLVLTFSAIYSKGDLKSHELLQLMNAGYNPMPDLAYITGKQIANLMVEMTSGKISFDMIEKSLEHATSKDGRFYGMKMVRRCFKKNNRNIQ